MSDKDFTLEKLQVAKNISELSSAIAKMEANIQNMSQNHKDTSQWISDLLKKHNETLFGDGNGKRGMLVRLDRLETSEDDRKKHFILIYASLIGVAIKTGWEWFWKHP